MNPYPLVFRTSLAHGMIIHSHGTTWYSTVTMIYTQVSECIYKVLYNYSTSIALQRAAHIDP